jgi:PAS domain S-box-containing protein
MDDVSLRADSELLRGLLDNSPAGIMAFRSVRDPAGAIVDFEWTLFNAGAEALVGRTAASLLGKRMRVEMPARLAEGLFERCVRVVETGRPDRAERFVEQPGGGRWFQTSTFRHADGVVATFTDVTARRCAEEEKERILELSQDLICVAGMDGYFKYVNPAWERTLGYTPDELLTQPFLTFIHPDDHRKNDDEVSSLRGGRWTLDFENRYVHKDGSIRFISWTAVPLEAEGVIYCIGRDMTARRRAESASRQSEQTLRTVIDHVPAWLAFVDAEGRYVVANSKYTETFGKSLDQIVGRRFDEVFPQLVAVHGPLVARCLAGETVEFDDVLPFNPMDPTYIHGVYRPVFGADGRVTHLTAVTLDVTATHRMEEQVRQAQKMQALGTLASGIAHDFNNLLTGIASHAGFLQTACEEAGLPVGDALGILHLQERGAALTQKLLALGRRQITRAVPTDLNALLRAFVPLVQRLVGERVEVTVQLDPSLPAVEADPAQMEQALLNLVANARDAMAGAGRLAFETQALPPAAGATVGSARLVVRDSGPGIPADVADRVFEPFFTTKEVGRGTGLGLAVVHGIVQQHGGSIHVVSEAGRGAEFLLTLPGTTRAPLSVALDPRVADESRRIAARALTILVAEDDPDLGFLLRRVLMKAGYTVLLVVDGEAAVTTFRAHAADVALVVLDLVMPRLEGLEALAVMRTHAPELRAVLISGYSEALRSGPALQDERVHFLPKPFANEALLDAVATMLAHTGK